MSARKRTRCWSASVSFRLASASSEVRSATWRSRFALCSEQQSPLVFKLLGHGVETLGQEAQLVPAEMADPVSEIAALG
jgi:hypothetical protein